jgi:copper resistance protein B
MTNHIPTAARATWLLIVMGIAPSAMAERAGWPPPVEDHLRFGRLLFDRLEYAHGEEELVWDVQGWYGGDYHRLWVETEGEDVVSGGDGGEAEAHVAYSRLVAPFWDFQAGLGYERLYGPGPDHARVFAVVGFEGLAPYWFEFNPELRVSEGGDFSARLEAEYDLLFTQRLILQPRFETAVALQDVEAFGVGQGFNYVEAGLRLRYEFRREFAPYIGVSWTRRLGETADLARDEGEDVESAFVVAGVRVWF